jgi:pyrimidine-nucleoside phosphorylase
MRLYDLIMKKRNGGTLSTEEIHQVIGGYTSGAVPDYQMAALLMAIYFRGMNRRETLDLTHALMTSGEILDLSEVPGPKIDKHSTGGVGDKISLVAAPLAAAAGITVPMLSGRGLGHTGGTLDKLEAIPGFRTALRREEFLAGVGEIGIAIMGQADYITPADGMLYALRDVTATVDCIPLIAASIMSKKLAEGIDGLVLDVKVGSGAFMKSIEEARELAHTMVAIGSGLGREVIALITEMDQPLGHAVGNALEVREAVEILSGGGPADVRELSIRIAGEMLLMAGLSPTLADAEVRLADLIADGVGLAKFRELIARQGGDPSVAEAPVRLPVGRLRREIPAAHAGFVEGIATDDIGIAAILLGAGRERKEDRVAPGAGLLLHKKRGDAVGAGETLATLFTNDAHCFPGAERRVRLAIQIGKKRIDNGRLLLDRVTVEG